MHAGIHIIGQNQGPLHPQNYGSAPGSVASSPRFSHPRRRARRQPGVRIAPRPHGMPPLRADYGAFGPCQCVYAHCHARFWYEERLSTSTRRSGPLYHRCYMGGRFRELQKRMKFNKQHILVMHLKHLRYTEQLRRYKNL